MISVFNTYALIILILWACGIIYSIISLSLKKKQSIPVLIMFVGSILLGIYIAQLWINLERPPLRTLGETRLWYSFFLSVTGIIIYWRWRLKWMPVYATSMSVLFLLLNFFKPENFDKTLMPALQSPWFAPHVIVYILAYALLAVSTLIAIKGLYNYYYKDDSSISLLKQADSIVYTGFSFLTFGLLFGALWAKEAWGHYWTWDPKETWAFITWMGYLLYMHSRLESPKNVKRPLMILSVAFLILIICWFGVNYLPSASNSVHVYSN